MHRWFRYSAGFSARWAADLIERETRAGQHVLDPFAGSGTTLLAAASRGRRATGLDAHGFIARVARAKLCHRSSPDAFLSVCERVLAGAERARPALDAYPALIHRCFARHALGQLDRLKQQIDTLDDSPAARLAWLTLAAILRPTSHAGTANWQYLLPDRRKRRVLAPFCAFADLAREVAADMRATATWVGPPPELHVADARACEPVPDDSADFVLTSPPYPNNFDYADATRLEMTFFGEVERWRDLQQHVRRFLVRSCSQHVSEKNTDIGALLAADPVAPIRDDLTAVCERLAEVRRSRGGRKTYHLMVAAYFHDLGLVWRALRRVCRDGARACFVAGDSAPYGVHVPVFDWLGRLAEAERFSGVTLHKTRDRNVRWRNRKHRVPLAEGQLWVRG